MGPEDAALEFVRRFCGAEIDRLAEILSPDLRFRGPFLKTDSAAAYLAELRRDPPERAEFAVHHLSVAEDTAALFYDYVTPGGSLFVAQLTKVRGGKIVEIRLVFDARGIADPGSGNARERTA